MQGIAGPAGAPGAPGPAGPAGPPGTGGGGTLGYTGGTVGLTGCDDTIRIEIGRQFTTDGFHLKNIVVSGIDPDKCENQKVFIYVTTDITIRCEKPLPIGATSIVFGRGLTCYNEDANENIFPFFDNLESPGITIAALNPAIGVEITE